MAPAKAAIKNAQNAHNVQAGLKPDEKRMIYSILANLEGQIDFKAVAADIEAVNAEAVRKRFKRFLTKERIETTVQGDRIGGQNPTGSSGITTPSSKTLEKPAKVKKVEKANEPAPMAVETPTLKTKKRKADQLREDNDEAEEAEQTEFKIEEGDTD